MAEKQCFKCLAIKPLKDFYKHPMMADGHLGKCKECNKRDVKENRKAKIEYYREFDRNRAMLAHRVRAREEYQKTPAGKASVERSRKKWESLNFYKRQASTIVGNAVRDGRMIKIYKCENCGITKGRIHGHHDDYTKPYSVRWLCSKCHTSWHKLNGSGYYPFN